MKRLGDVLTDLAKKAGLNHADVNLKELQALTTPVPDEVENALFGLMNTQEAEAWGKGHVGLKSHYTAQAYNGIDRKLHDSAEAMGFTDEEKEQIKNEKNTGKKQDLFNEFLKAKMEEAKKGQNAANKKGDDEAVKKWEAEHKKLSDQLNKTKEEYENQLKQKDESFYSYKLNAKYDSVLGSQKWSDNYPQNLRSEIGRLAIEKALNEAGAKTMLDENGEIKIVRKDNPDMPYFDSSNKNPKFAEFATKIMSENKFLAVSPPTPNNSNNSMPPVAPGVTSTQNTNKRPNPILTSLQQSIKDQQG
jgi:hypothetical protein